MLLYQHSLFGIDIDASTLFTMILRNSLTSIISSCMFYGKLAGTDNSCKTACSKTYRNWVKLVGPDNRCKIKSIFSSCTFYCMYYQFLPQ